MIEYDAHHEAAACTNELFYRDGPSPRDIPRGQALFVGETIERYLREAYEAGEREAIRADAEAAKRRLPALMHKLGFW